MYWEYSAEQGRFVSIRSNGAYIEGEEIIYSVTEFIKPSLPICSCGSTSKYLS